MIFIQHMNPYEGYHWAHRGAFPNHRIAIVAQAKRTIQSILNRLTYSVFLDVSNFDRERRAFWERYIPQLSNVKFYLSKATYRKLKSSGRKFFPESVIQYASEGTHPPTLLMEYNNTIILEFGITANACYFYNRKSPEYHDIFEGRRPKSEKDLKVTHLPMTYLRGGQGRLRHGNSWQYEFERQLRLNFQLRANL
jgi:uncharacterized protein (DUF1330 family)